MNNKICIAFVDPIIASSYLTQSLRQYGIKLVAVFTLQLSAAEEKLRMHPEEFDEVIYFKQTDDLANVAAQLKNFSVNYIFYGYEGSVAITDLLAQAVCPQFANDAATSNDRNDKYAMQEAIRIAGIPAVKQLRVNKNSLAKAQAELQKWNFPVFVKPIHGSVSIAVKKM